MACAGETLGFIGWVGFMHPFWFLFIFLYSLLMCLTKGQTLINRGVGLSVTTIFMATPLKCSLSVLLWIASSFFSL